MLHAIRPGRRSLSTAPFIEWTEAGRQRSAPWLSDSGAAPPRRIVLADDHLRADEAYGLACQGTGLLWRGDFHNGRQLLRALAQRADRSARKHGPSTLPVTPADRATAFHRHRQLRAQRARTLGALLVELDEAYCVPLRRAPDVHQACVETFGPARAAAVISLRALQGLIGAHQWRTQGIEVPALGGRIHPHYGVFAPIRSEYLDLASTVPLPTAVSSCGTAFDVGTGTGVLAALLARRGLRRVLATEVDPRALRCAQENISRLGLTDQVECLLADLFPPGRAALIVCNPPWLPARPSSPLERAVYDPDSQMLRGFLGSLAAHLEPHGEGWLILSDLAEHLGLRSREELLAHFERAQLRVAARHDIRPRHPKAIDAEDPLHVARAAEVTSLWRLTAG
jgi:SAM-dependent methyltransferase